MFVDDPRAEEYDKHGRYYPVETEVYRASSIATAEEMMEKNDNLNLFHRGDKEAQDKQLKQMNFKADFFRKHQATVAGSRKSTYFYKEQIHARKFK